MRSAVNTKAPLSTEMIVKSPGMRTAISPANASTRKAISAAECKVSLGVSAMGVTK
jgi:hypothetical protein